MAELVGDFTKDTDSIAGVNQPEPLFAGADGKQGYAGNMSLHERFVRREGERRDAATSDRSGRNARRARSGETGDDRAGVRADMGRRQESQKRRLAGQPDSLMNEENVRDEIEVARNYRWFVEAENRNRLRNARDRSRSASRRRRREHDIYADRHGGVLHRGGMGSEHDVRRFARCDVPDHSRSRSRSRGQSQEDRSRSKSRGGSRSKSRGGSRSKSRS
jgi:hypothetical protein